MDDSKFFNKVNFPSVLSDILDTQPLNSSDPFYCYFNTLSPNVYTLIFVDTTYSGSGSRFDSVPALLNSDGSFSPIASVSSPPSLRRVFGTALSDSLLSYCAFPDSTPLFYGVEPSSDVILPATLLAIAFFTLIYKMFKRVLF